MYELRVVTLIRATPERCFDLARSVDAHLTSADQTDERIVDGPTTGLLELNDAVTFEARHLGVRQRLTSRITAFDRPSYFQDRMVRGIFKSFEHDHHFQAVDGHTEMLDVVRFEAPLGPLGWIVERLIVGPHLRRFIKRRADVLKRLAEAGDQG